MEPRLAPLRDEKLGALGFVVAGERLVDGVMEQEREVHLGQTKLGEAVSRVEAGKNVCPVVVPAVRLCVPSDDTGEEALGAVEREPVLQDSEGRRFHEESVEPIDWCYNQSMGRPSARLERRSEVARAFARVLGTHGQGGATIARVAAEAGIAPGLVHHHFKDKSDLYETLLLELVGEFRRRTDASANEDPLLAYVDAALALDERSDIAAARAWVGIFAEALSDPVLFGKLRRVLDAEVMNVERRSEGELSTGDASAVVAFVVGSLVFGAFAPRKAAGFAAPTLKRVLAGCRASSSRRPSARK